MPEDRGILAGVVDESPLMTPEQRLVRDVVRKLDMNIDLATSIHLSAPSVLAKAFVERLPNEWLTFPPEITKALKEYLSL
jgi:hypothetical protein